MKRQCPRRAWCDLPPGHPYQCKSKLIGKTVPGRGGGTVTSCATPAADRPRRGQVMIDRGPGKSPAPMDGRKASRRIRDAARPRHSSGPLDVWGAVRAVEAGEIVPTDYEWPHRGGACCSRSAYWQGVEAELGDAAAYIGAELELDPTEARREASRGMRDTPQGAEAWRRATACADAAQARLKPRRVTETASRATNRRRRSYVAAGGDTGSFEWRDTLAAVTDRPRKRRR